MNCFIVEVDGEDYHGVEGADFLKKDNVIYIYHDNRSGMIPKLYFEILKRTEAGVFFCKNERCSTAIEDRISQILTSDNPADVIYIGHGRAYDFIPSFDTIMGAVYAGCIADAEMNERFEDLEEELKKKDAFWEIAESLSLDFIKLLRVYAANENDTKKLYQELKHEFGGNTGLMAYRSLKENEIGPFRKAKVKQEAPEPIIYSDITLEKHREMVLEEKKKRLWLSCDFTPYWREKSIYEEDEDEFF